MKQMYKDGIKVLAIGNSFSQDAMCYLYDLLCQAGVNKNSITLVNACIGGCDLYTHAQNVRSNASAYIRQTFYYGGNMQISEQLYSLKDLIKSQAWDVITLQQSSAGSGNIYTYNADLEYVVKYIKTHAVNPLFRLGWHMTWAYCENPPSIHPNFADYGFNQKRMYDMICGAVKNRILPSGAFDFVISSGTAIQNVRNYFGDILTNAEDGFHLNNLGRYIAAASWACALGCNIENLTAPYSASSDGPAVLIDKDMLTKIVKSVNYAADSPFTLIQG